MENNFNYTEKNLSALSLMDLRKIGMTIGVKVPSKLRKAELINEIIAIYSGEKEPYKKIKSGRKILTLQYENDWVERLKELTIEKNKMLILYECDYHIQKLKIILKTDNNQNFLSKLSKVLECY